MFEDIEISPYGSNLIFKDGYTIEFVKSILAEKKLSGLKINTRWISYENLDFLNDYAFLETLDITGGKNINFNFLKNLKNLKDLSISVIGDKEIYLDNLYKLENLTIHWRKKKVVGLDHCTSLKSLCLINFNENNLLQISNLKELSSLMIKTSSIKDMSGIEKLTKLEKLLVGDCNKLCSLKSLEVLKNIKSLHFEYCRKIIDFSEIKSLTDLEYLKIDDCRQVSSIKFLDHLLKLKKITLLGNTDIVDGDLIPASKVSEVLFKNRTHYNIYK